MIKLLISNFAHTVVISECIRMKKLSTTIAVSTVERVKRGSRSTKEVTWVQGGNREKYLI